MDKERNDLQRHVIRAARNRGSAEDDYPTAPAAGATAPRGKLSKRWKKE